ncbi:LOW QUALITY PROTEIN: acetylornithine aminotransferase [Bacillus sp. JCM 19045]|nr:LOW QUALITY PROTEIN: acetylornithine aminotransferase [Bacillus sp. JCM 19045]
MSYLFPTYAKKEIELTQGNGATLFSKDGSRYLDFMSGIAVTNLGHGHPGVIQALHKQADLLWHGSNLFHYEAQEAAAKLLVENSVCDVVFFCNSGTEQTRRPLNLLEKQQESSHIISMNQSFHGRTLGSMAATGQSSIHAGYGPMLASFSYAIFNQIETVKDAITEDTAAVMVEVIQGEGGVHVMTQSFADELQELCKEKQLLLIIDEVQTGMGRTGKWFGYEHVALDPDIITVAKGLGNGFPVGAMLAKDHLREAFHLGSHGSTFGGNPLAMAVSSAVMNQLNEPGFLGKSEATATFLMNQLKDVTQTSSIVKEVRGQGFLIGVETTVEASILIKACEEKGLLLLPAGVNVIRFLPPITIEKEECNQAVSIFQAAIRECTEALN